MSSSPVRCLVIMRHAKTETHAVTDHARVLTKRGERNAGSAGRWLAESRFEPEVILVSSAARARGTVTAMLSAFAGEPEVLVLDELYGADENEALALVAAHVPPEAGAVLVVGHNPTMAAAAYLVQTEDDRQPTDFPTSGLAVFEIETSWADAGPGTGTLVASHRPG